MSMSSKEYTEGLHYLKNSPTARFRSEKDIPSLPYTAVPSRQHIPSLNALNNSKTNLSSKNIFSDHEQRINQDIITVLKEENINLKQQNCFLLQKLRIIAAKEQQSTDLASKQQSIYTLLKNQNLQLKKELKYASQLANSKVQELGKKLDKLSKSSQFLVSEKQISLKDLNPPGGILQLRCVQSDSEKQDSDKKSQKQSERFKRQEDHTRDVMRSLQDLNSEFQAILYSCKVQKDNHKRKQYRKRLVQLTNKMKTLNR